MDPNSIYENDTCYKFSSLWIVFLNSRFYLGSAQFWYFLLLAPYLYRLTDQHWMANEVNIMPATLIFLGPFPCTQFRLGQPENSAAVRNWTCDHMPCSRWVCYHPSHHSSLVHSQSSRSWTISMPYLYGAYGASNHMFYRLMWVMRSTLQQLPSCSQTFF